MNTPNIPDGVLPELRFGDAEPLGTDAQQQGLNCVMCTVPIDATYFALADQVLCPRCKDIVLAPPQGSAFVRFLKASCLGTLAGLVGAVIWYAIRVIAHVEIGLVAILVGYMVGKAIHTASGRKGGVGYQVLAVLITYGCISANYMPDIFQELVKIAEKQPEVGDAADTGDVDGAVAVAAPVPKPDVADNLTAAKSTTEGAAEPADSEPVKQAKPALENAEIEMQPLRFTVAIVLLGLITFVAALATPVLNGMDSPISLLIVGFALWQAWKLSAHRPLPISGPYQAGGETGPLNGFGEPAV